MEAVMEQTEADEKLDAERAKLMEYKKNELLEIAGNMSLEVGNGNTKAQIIDAILEKSRQMAAAIVPVAEAEEGLSPAIEPERGLDEGEAEMRVEYLTRLKHLMFTVGEKFIPEAGIVDVQFLDQEINIWLERSYNVVHFDAVGFTPDGHRLLWVFEKTEKPKYTQSKHVIRTLTAQADTARKTITGFQADAYVSYLMENEGWELVGVRYNGQDVNGAGLFMVWMLAK